MIFYAVETRVVAPDEALIFSETFNPAEERLKAEKAEKEMRDFLGSRGGYSPNPLSLACWAAARKCEGRDFYRPPPPNKTPLEHSDRATRMQAEYDSMFVPSCKQ